MMENSNAHQSHTGLTITVIVLAVVVALIVIGALVLLILARSKIKSVKDVFSSRPPRQAVLPKYGLNDHPGATTKEQFYYVGSAKQLQEADGVRSILANDKIVCQPPHWGPRCELQTHNPAFVAVGRASVDDIQFSESASKTFQQCQALALSEAGVTGFFYERGQCQLFRDVPVLDGLQPPVYGTLTEHNLYFKKGIRPKVLRMVYLYAGYLPQRFWLEPDQQTNNPESSSQFLALQPGYCYYLSFQPTAWVNDSSLRLALHDREFDDPSQATTIVNSLSFHVRDYPWVMCI